MGLAHCAHRSACRGKLGGHRCHGKIEIDFPAKVFGSWHLDSKSNAYLCMHFVARFKLQPIVRRYKKDHELQQP